jgi:hypothetical protein
MNSLALASPVVDVVFIITQNLFPDSRDQTAVSMVMANLLSLPEASSSNHMLRPGVQTPLGNFILVTVGLLHPVCRHDPENYIASHRYDDYDCCLSVPGLVLFHSGGINFFY